MAIYGKKIYIFNGAVTSVIIDTTSFHGTITASSLTPRVGERVNLSCSMNSGYSLRYYALNGEKITGSSFIAKEGTNTITAVDTTSATYLALNSAPVLTFLSVVSNTSDNLKLNACSLSFESIVPNQYDSSSLTVLAESSGYVVSIKANQIDPYESLVLNSASGEWVDDNFYVTVIGTSTLTGANIFVSGTKLTSTTETKLSSGNVQIKGIYSAANSKQGQSVYAYATKDYYTTSSNVYFTVATKPEETSKTITVYIYHKEKSTDTYPTTASISTITGTADDTCETIFGKLVYGGILDETNSSYSYSSAVCKLYYYDTVVIPTLKLTSPEISNLYAKYWDDQSQNGKSLNVAFKIANSNSINAVANISIEGDGHIQLSDTISVSMTKNSYQYLTYTYDNLQIKATDSIIVSATLSPADTSSLQKESDSVSSAVQVEERTDD